MITKCLECKERISEKRKRRHAKYCSRNCREVNYIKTNKGKIMISIPTGTVGAISEMLACSFFLKRGYSVFRSISPASKHDLVIIKNCKTQTVQVRSGRLNPNTGKLYFSRNQILSDILIVVLSNGKILRNPSLD